jgi:RimJ/RimL family protein N-acetyltransferase
VFAQLYGHVLGAARRDPEVCGLRLYVDADNHAAMAVYLKSGMADAHYRVYEVDFRRAAQTPG